MTEPARTDIIMIDRSAVSPLWRGVLSGKGSGTFTSNRFLTPF